MRVSLLPSVRYYAPGLRRVLKENMARCSHSRRPSVRRALHAKKRLSQLRRAYPQLSDDVLDRWSLRQLSYVTKRLSAAQALLTSSEDVALCHLCRCSCADVTVEL